PGRSPDRMRFRWLLVDRLANGGIPLLGCHHYWKRGVCSCALNPPNSSPATRVQMKKYLVQED
ncbi:MAG TPA: hypothetical protein VLC94_07660, partial [Candidatus Acidoferrum sp.]|nr:hypothetical protein [Candidatus Acidoferrum sp.]